MENNSSTATSLISLLLWERPIISLSKETNGNTNFSLKVRDSKFNKYWNHYDSVFYSRLSYNTKTFPKYSTLEKILSDASSEIYKLTEVNEILNQENKILLEGMCPKYHHTVTYLKPGLHK